MGKVHCNGHSVNSSIPYPTELFQFITFDWWSCRRSPKLSFPEWSKYLEEIATAKKLDVNEIKGKLAECGAPGTTGATVEQDFDFYFGKSSSCLLLLFLFSHFPQKVVKSTAVDRLTDTSKWANEDKCVFAFLALILGTVGLISKGSTATGPEEER